MISESAENEIRNNAADLGGNYVETDSLGGDGRGMTLSGRAFHCDQLPGDRVATDQESPPLRRRPLRRRPRPPSSVWQS